MPWLFVYTVYRLRALLAARRLGRIWVMGARASSWPIGWLKVEVYARASADGNAMLIYLA